MFIFKTMNDLNGYLAEVPRRQHKGFPERRTQERRNGPDWQDWTPMATAFQYCSGYANRTPPSRASRSAPRPRETPSIPRAHSFISSVSVPISHRWSSRTNFSYGGAFSSGLYSSSEDFNAPSVTTRRISTAFAVNMVLLGSELFEEHALKFFATGTLVNDLNVW